MCRCCSDVTDKGMRNFFDCEIFKYREDDEFYKNYELMKFEKIFIQIFLENLLVSTKVL